MGEIIEMKNEAVSKLKGEILIIKNNSVPAVPISNHLIGKCTDEEFKSLILIEHKTLDKCCKHVEKKAKEKLNSLNGWIADDEVYNWAEEYYRLDDAEIELQEAEQKIKAEDERKKREAEKKKQEAQPIQTKTKPKVKPKESEAQISLFDF